LGVVTVARTSDVLPRCAPEESSVALDHDSGDEHEGDAHQSKENGVRETKDENEQSDEETGDAPAHSPTAVGVNIRFSDVFGETGVLFGQ